MEQTEVASRTNTGAGASNLRVRIVTALILAPLVLLLLFCGPAWGWALFIALAAGQVAREMLAMTHPQDSVSRWVGAAMSFGICWLSYASAGDLRLFLTGLFCVLIVGAMLPLLRLGQIQTAGLRILGGISAPLYVGVLLSSLALLRRDPGALGSRYVLFTLFVAWTADTGGYAAGRMFGRTKLYEAVSPKKTREGLLGSIVLAVVVSIVGSLTYIGEISPAAAALLGALGAVLGQLGDLVESLLKRST
ncbi:MAG TPA: phosphatidate cytidylyltransferase, partial [Polyangiaceae bacterium]|nr:phosphatidate cytidylyltransferase [Polyangiaceae bacterium]